MDSLSEEAKNITPKPFKRQVTQILTPDGPVPVLIGKIEPILYDELCIMANWLMENSNSTDAIESSTQTYQMWIGFGSERFLVQRLFCVFIAAGFTCILFENPYIRCLWRNTPSNSFSSFG